MIWALLAACGGELDPWWDVDIGYTPAADTATDSGTADTDTDTGPLEDQHRLHGDLRQTGSKSVEVSLRYLSVEGGETLCDARYTSEKVRQVTCAPCMTAFSMLLDGGNVQTEQDSACTEAGWDSLDGSTLYVGLDEDLQAYHCTEGCADGTGEWRVAGSAIGSDGGLEFTINL